MIGAQNLILYTVIIIALLTVGLLNYDMILISHYKALNTNTLTIINTRTKKTLLGYDIWFLPIFVLCDVNIALYVPTYRTSAPPYIHS